MRSEEPLSRFDARTTLSLKGRGFQNAVHRSTFLATAIKLVPTRIRFPHFNRCRSRSSNRSNIRPNRPAGAACSFAVVSAFTCVRRPSFEGTVRIDGRFRGEISSENTLIVGESGEIEAKIKSRTVAVSGNVLGDVSASLKVVVHKTGRIEGNIETESLVIEEGAVINGVIRMGKPKELKAIDGGAHKPQQNPPKP